MVTTWPRDFPGLGQGANRLTEIIGRMSNGRLKIKVYGGGEPAGCHEGHRFDLESGPGLADAVLQRFGDLLLDLERPDGQLVAPEAWVGPEDIPDLGEKPAVVTLLGELSQHRVQATSGGSPRRSRNR
jgi:hypothetical protein